MRKRALILLCSLVLMSHQAMSGHLIGGEIFYECLEDGRYVISLKMYRDCYAGGSGVASKFDDTVYVSMLEGQFHTIYRVVSIPKPNDSTFLPLILDVPCLVDPPDLCVVEMVYRDTFELTIPPGGLHLINQRCCRTPDALNVVNSGQFGATYHAFIPKPADAFINSSPRFNEVPPKALCAEIDIDLDYSATDPDGDSLYYYFCTPYHGGNSWSPAPDTSSAPPFDTVNWAAGYSRPYQIPGSPSFQINHETGIISGRPDQIGTYLTAVCVQEYRNGIFLSENRRDFQMTTTYCEIDAAAAIDSAMEECVGLEIEFFNSSTLGVYFYWDFGDSTTLADTSRAYEPVYTYPDTGLYHIRLISSGAACSDTAYLDYRVLPKISPFFSPPEPDCFDRHLFRFSRAGDYRSTTEVSWKFPNDSIHVPLGAASIDSVRFDTPGQFPVTLWFDDFGCLKKYTDTVIVYANPSLTLDSTPITGCAPLHAYLESASSDAFKPRYNWWFDGEPVSDSASAHFVTTEAGYHDVRLRLITDSLCRDSVTIDLPALIQVLDTPQAHMWFENLTASVWEPYFTVHDSSVMASSVAFLLEDSLLGHGHTVHFALFDTGNYDVQLVATHANGCLDTAHQRVRVEPPYLIYTPNAFTPDGDNINDLWFPRVFVWSEFRISVYDRWGHVIFQSTDPNTGWNGKVHNVDAVCPIGVYQYQMVVVDEDHRSRTYYGAINLIR